MSLSNNSTSSNPPTPDEALCQRLAKLPDRVLLRAFDKPLGRELAALSYLEKTGLSVWWFNPDEWSQELSKDTKLAFIRYLLGNPTSQPHIAKRLRRKLSKVGKSVFGYTAVKTACQRIRLRRRSNKQETDNDDNTSLGSDLVIEEGNVWKMMEGDAWKFLTSSWDGTEQEDENKENAKAPVAKEARKLKNPFKAKKTSKPLKCQKNQTAKTKEEESLPKPEAEEWVILESDFWKVLLGSWDDSSSSSVPQDAKAASANHNEQSRPEEKDGWKLFQGDVWQSILPSWESESTTCDTRQPSGRKVTDISIADGKQVPR